MEKNLRVFSEIPASRFHDDRLHRHEAGRRGNEVPTSSYTKTVVMAMTTVFIGKNCALHINDLSQTAF
ncbi:hypothetical protein [uncultured Parabacteroides sp.]|uniref:hypothetical protein n=1 Tax=uncultured Parabacteroides sp. TaxID=512312 RepID=UPI0026EAB76F|nr:hypothetical protein [uncultured Parabacteroides sp.]